ncbi:sodium:solute symporter [Maioricimonas sp. JC845]|uniref:sodium:solute symporter n=1 Tax=Maioricimonas sp. JC845 TaxID=3232138 RepID=UPI00345B26CC
MQALPTVDIAVLVVYVAAVVAYGSWFVRKSGTTDEFMAAGRSLPGWAVGLSIFGTYLSSNTFLGVPGKAYGSNWNSFVFSLSLPIAAMIAVRWFVPFYRHGGTISAYEHFEKRFGLWARTYAVICYLLTQIARTGTVLFGVSLAMQPLLGWDLRLMIIGTGIVVTMYTLLGGIEAVIWTDVMQSLVLMVGAFIVTGLLLFGMPEGPAQVIEIAREAEKFSLGSFSATLTESTFWVVLIYGLFINLNNFGIDQSFIQRYHTAKSDGDAARSVWLGALLYVPISLLFFFIGSCLFAYYEAHPDRLEQVRLQVAEERLEAEGVPTDSTRVKEVAAELTPADIGDKVLPNFIVSKLPTGMAGLLIAAIFAAAMSSIDTSLNSSATILLSDIYKRYVNPDVDEKGSMRVLYAGTLLWGTLGTGAALAMIGIRSVLDAWWELQGIFAGALLGLFLLGLIVRKADNVAATIAVVLGVLSLVWLTFSPRLPDEYGWLRNSLHANLTIVAGTLSIFLVGLIVTAFRRESP